MSENKDYCETLLTDKEALSRSGSVDSFLINNKLKACIIPGNTPRGNTIRHFDYQMNGDVDYHANTRMLTKQGHRLRLSEVHRRC